MLSFLQYNITFVLQLNYEAEKIAQPIKNFPHMHGNWGPGEM